MLVGAQEVKVYSKNASVLIKETSTNVLCVLLIFR